MGWFKICLLVFIGIDIPIRLAILNGWKVERASPFALGLGITIDLLIFLGVWFWL